MTEIVREIAIRALEAFENYCYEWENMSMNARKYLDPYAKNPKNLREK